VHLTKDHEGYCCALPNHSLTEHRNDNPDCQSAVKPQKSDPRHDKATKCLPAILPAIKSCCIDRPADQPEIIAEWSLKRTADSNQTHNDAPTCTSSCSLLALALLLTRYGSPRSSWSALLLLPPLLLLLLLLLPGRATPVFSAMKPSTLSALSMPVTHKLHVTNMSVTRTSSLEHKDTLRMTRTRQSFA
jgi:hypothetical protein